MTKISVTFEADSWAQLTADLRSAIHTMEHMPAQPTTVDKIFEQEEARLAAEAFTSAPAAPKAKAPTKKRPESVVAPPPPPAPEPEPPGEPEPEPVEIPTLEELKQAVTVAVRAAQKNGGPRKILDLLPDFKASTGLDFVMNSKEEHRGALFDLINKAGIKAGQLAAV